MENRWKNVEKFCCCGKNEVKYVKSNSTVKRIKCIFEMDWMLAGLTMMMAETKKCKHQFGLYASKQQKIFEAIRLALE